MIVEALFTSHYNTTIVYLSTAALGIAAGLVGCFLILRKQALISDAITHATLPGIGIGFLLSILLGLEDGRFLPLLLLCAGITASIGAASVRFISKNTRLSTDTAIASVMSFFYGSGLVILSIIQNMESGNKAGLNSFLLGAVSGITAQDLTLLCISSLITIWITTRYFRSLRLLCFDESYAKLISMNIKKAEYILLFLTVLVICIGLKTVGLILIIALLIIPPITARLWTAKSEFMLVLSAILGLMGTTAGVYLSIQYNLPTGSTIVLAIFILFIASLSIQKVRGLCHA